MSIIVDTHVHLYACYRLDMALSMLARELHARATRTGDPNAALAACLTESCGCDVFADLHAGSVALPASIRITPGAEAGALHVAVDEINYTLFAGRQLIPSERIEILALATNAVIADGLPAEQTVRCVLDAGGIAVVSWAPGKWFFARGRVVAGLFDAFPPDVLAVGDTSLRPLGWGEPALMHRTHARGAALLAGSDPLPFAGEERRMAAYVSLLKGTLDLARPVASLREGLRTAGPDADRIGRRGDPVTVAYRVLRNAVAGRGR